MEIISNNENSEVKTLYSLYNNFSNKLNAYFVKHNYFIIIISLILSIYPFWDSTKPNLIYETEIKNQNGIKFLYSIKVINNGDVNLKTTDFDDLPWGLRVINGKIENKEYIVSSNSKYIVTQNKINLLNDSEIEFSKLFFDAGDSFSFDLEILKDKDKEIIFESIGKISGIKTMEIDPFVLTNIALIILKWITLFIFWVIFIIFIGIIPYLIKELYQIFFIQRKAKKIFNNNKEKFSNFDDFKLFLFFFKFFSSDLKKMKQLIEYKKDIMDYHQFLTTGKRQKDKSYDIVEAEHHIKKGCGSVEEIEIYLVDCIYNSINKYLDFSETNLVIKNENNIKKYIDVIFENKNPKESGSVNSYTFIMN